MSYFTRIAEGLNVAAALAEVLAQGGKPYRPDAAEQARRALQGMGEANPAGTLIVGSRSFSLYPAVQRLLFRAAGRLGPQEAVWKARVKILPPRASMLPHRDDLPPAERRYQIAIQCDDHAYFDIDGERCSFRPGEMWHVDLADRLHYVHNGSEKPRIVLIFDTLPPALAEAATAKARAAASAAARGTTGDMLAPSPRIPASRASASGGQD